MTTGFNRLVRRQKGVFARRQARECGFSAAQIRHRLANGEWQRVLGSSYALAGVALTQTVVDRAAQLSVAGSVLAGPSAARVWGIEVPDRRTYLYVGSRGRCHLPGVVAVHVDPDSNDVRLADAIPTTIAPCAVVECLRLLPEPAARTLLDRSLQAGWLTTADLARRIGREVGRHGNRRLVTLLRMAAGGERADSERALTRALRSAGIGGWRPNADIHDRQGLIGVGDIVFEAAKLVVELDGWAYHSAPDRFQRDRNRQNRLVAAGWTVLRFTWHDITERSPSVVAAIRRQLCRSPVPDRM